MFCNVVVFAGLSFFANIFLYGQQIDWKTDIESAKQQAIESQRLVWVHFEADWCLPCQQLKTFVFSDTAFIRSVQRNVVAVKIDADDAEDLVAELGVRQVPFDVVMTPAGRVIVSRPSPDRRENYVKMFDDLDLALQQLNAGNRKAINSGIGQIHRIAAQTSPAKLRPSDLDLQGPKHEMAADTVQGQRLRRGFEAAERAKQSRAENALRRRQQAQQYIIAEKRKQQSTEASFSENPFFKKNQKSDSGSTTKQNRDNPNVKRPVSASKHVGGNSFSSVDQTDLRQTKSKQQISQASSAKAEGIAKVSFINESDITPVPIPSTAKNNHSPALNLLRHQEPKSLNNDVGKPPKNDLMNAEVATNPRPASSDAVKEHALVLVHEKSGPANDRAKKVNSGQEGPQYALQGKCPVTLITESRWVDGQVEIGCVHRNQVYLFASEQHRKAFLADPDAFSPLLAGFDPVLFEQSGQLVDGQEQFGIFMGEVPNQRIILFQSLDTQKQFQAQPTKYLNVIRRAMTDSASKMSGQR